VATYWASAITSPSADSPSGGAGASQVALDSPDHLVRERRRRRHVLVDDRLDGWILLRGIGLADVVLSTPRIERVVDDLVLRAGLHELAGLVVERQGDVGEDPAERRSARDEPGHAARSDGAAVLVVRVGGDDDLDPAVEPLGDLVDVAAGQVARAAVERRGTAASRLPCRSLNASTWTSVVLPFVFASYAIETGSEIDRAPAMTTSADALFGDASVAARTAPTTAASISGTIQRTHRLPRACLVQPPFFRSSICWMRGEC
jgi:hypothetical protein